MNYRLKNVFTYNIIRFENVEIFSSRNDHEIYSIYLILMQILNL